MLVGRSPGGSRGPGRRGAAPAGRSPAQPRPGPAGGTDRQEPGASDRRDPWSSRRQRTRTDPAGPPPPGTEWARQARTAGPAGGSTSAGRDDGQGPPRRGRPAEEDGGASARETAGRSGPRASSPGAPGTGGRGPNAPGEGEARRPSSGGGAGHGRQRRRASLGSTSYDGADTSPEPTWEGASWYGPSSGTYWTLNPKEYADPRRHGPDYLARARRAAGSDGPGAGEPGVAPPATDAGAPGRSAAQPGRNARNGRDPASRGPAASPGPATSPEPAASREPVPGARASREWPADARPAPGPGASGAPSAPASAHPRAASTGRSTGRSTGPSTPPAPPPVRPSGASAATGSAAAAAWPAPSQRLLLATVAWIGPGLALALAVGLPGGLVATLPLQVAGLALAARLPRLAWIGAAGLVGVLVAWVPAALVLTAFGEPGGPAGVTPDELGLLAAITWAAGILVAATGLVVPPPWRAGE